LPHGRFKLVSIFEKKKGGLSWTSHTHIYPQLEFGLSKPHIEDEPPQFREEN